MSSDRPPAHHTPQCESQNASEAEETLTSLEKAGLIDCGRLTPAGYKSLQPYKVNNAVILATGSSSRCTPLTYETPEGLLTVRGEVLIEREIQQLQHAGISNIFVVVGYMKEKFNYLAPKFGVHIIPNPDYTKHGNISSLLQVLQHCQNTYICSSADYFTHNVFKPYVYESYHAVQPYNPHTPARGIAEDENGRIVDAAFRRTDWQIVGQAYINQSFSQRLAHIMQDIHRNKPSANQSWEDIYVAHLDLLHMAAWHDTDNIIHEFNTVDDLSAFDPDVLNTVDSPILDNICHTLSCKRTDIHDCTPIKAGLTNQSCRFCVNDEAYVYRHPGNGTNRIINRQSEAYAQNVAKTLGIDQTFIYEDVTEGWKISKFMDHCTPLDYHNHQQVQQAMHIARNLHNSGKTSQWTFNSFQKAEGIASLLLDIKEPFPQDFNELHTQANALDAAVQRDKVQPVLCHNDFYNQNFLVSGTDMSLIDWEYSAMSDYASDLGTFVCSSDYTIAEADTVFTDYFQRTPTTDERRHCFAYVGLAGYYWFMWSLYKKANGDPVGSWSEKYHHYAKEFGGYAYTLYYPTVNQAENHDNHR